MSDALDRLGELLRAKKAEGAPGKPTRKRAPVTHNVVDGITPTGYRLLDLYHAAREQDLAGVVGSKWALAHAVGGCSLRTLSRAVKSLRFDKRVRVIDRDGFVALVALQSDSGALPCMYVQEPEVKKGKR